MTGKVGSASALQALTSLVGAAGLAVVVEALQVGRRLGLAPATMLEALGHSGDGQALADLVAEQILSGRFASGQSLAASNARLATALALATATRTDVPLARLTGEIWRMAEAALEPGADRTALARWYEHRSGTRLRS